MFHATTAKPRKLKGINLALHYMIFKCFPHQLVQALVCFSARQEMTKTHKHNT